MVNIYERTHYSRHEENGQRSYICKYCSHRVKSLSGIRTHIRKRHPIEFKSKGQKQEATPTLLTIQHQLFNQHHHRCLVFSVIH